MLLQIHPVILENFSLSNSNISFLSCIWFLDLAMLCDNLCASEKASLFSQLKSGVNF